ncbi:putative protein [Arabidopsis thaliana]|uniref:Uncharacterized protein n=2 Tax=Arabidopsis thaliana TaxID=3702 RepID=A0A654FWW4_ARATH|nr:uncharacterized protein AT4G38820 [Arabidopsis thaliana]AAR24153.1 At4g38820 [Arabidopsis thaliana]AAR92315.1 At4g38820 [Arabidopsis thaliana]AEE86980.1 hypothetical protein AT4G38820 [Arabidopsis thaliana]CAA0397945.1 unnamed protein product [Arabidopsis thaliana]CAB38616.1 putative protein [Arabidopsis thaliana]|eukprot:NP_195593.1 hypothetical protein AT4G38820 [Arabidopsis thaliana]
MYLQGKGWSSRPLDDQTQTLVQIYSTKLEMKAGSNMRLALCIFSSGFLQRTLQETLLVSKLPLIDLERSSLRP